MLINFLLASVLMILTTGIHAVGMAITLWILRNRYAQQVNAGHPVHWLQLSSIILLMFLVVLIEAVLWALVYFYGLNTLEQFEAALYFSMVTYTTLGYGDIVLPPELRLLSSFQAATGIIMFGWTTAIVIAAVQRIFHIGHSN